MKTQLEKNKDVVIRFNKEVIENGNVKIFEELMHSNFINQSAPEGTDHTSQGMIDTFNTILRPGIPDIKVTIHQQVAEGDLVTTQKTINGTHTGMLLGIAPTGRNINIDVIDVVRIKDGKYFEHWGINTFALVLQQLKE